MIKNRIEELCRGEIEVKIFDIIDSTNSYAKRTAMSDDGGAPTLIIAKEQTSGRGRMGRSFLSRADRGIFMSLLYYTDKPLSDAVSVTTAAAAIVAREIEAVCGKPMKIKWVNDIYNEKGKVCGILAETLPKGGRLAVIIGVGINIGEDSFPEELSGIASSIGDIGENAELLAANIALGLLEHSKHPEDKGYMAEYRKRFMLFGESVSLLKNGETVGSGVVVGVDDDGGLMLIPDGESDPVIISSGEVSVRKK